MTTTGRNERDAGHIFHDDAYTQRRGRAFALLLAALPGALLVAILLGDYLTADPTYRFLAPLIIAVPPLAAATSGTRGVFVFTALSVGLNFLLASLSDRLYGPGFYGLLVGLAVIFAISLLPGYQRERREYKLAQARTVAEAVQRAVLVPLPERIDCLHTAAAYIAADEEARIGGDLYEAVDTPYGVRMIMGDVRGKGLASVGATASLLGAFREAAPHAANLPTLAERLEESVQRYNVRAGLEPDDFITATIVSVSPDSGVAQMVCCGHPGPLLIRAGETAEVQATRPSPPLGLGEYNVVGYHVDKLRFDVGDCLLLYTDGVTEARGSSGTFYPLADRVGAWVDAGPDHLLRQLVQDLKRYTGGRLGDDAALLACQRRTPADGGTPGAGPGTAFAADREPTTDQEPAPSPDGHRRR